MLSFIVPAHDEERHVGATVRAIRAAGEELGEPFEVIVVDDASTDRTAEVAEAAGANVIHVQNRQIAATRNAGARVATGEILFFVDADTLVNGRAVKASVAAIRAGACGGGCVFTFDGILPLWARVLYPFAVFFARELRLVGGCCLFCTRTAFAAVGGFDERYFAAEEAEFIKALKRLGEFVVPEPVVITSGRKLRAFSCGRILREVLRWTIGGARTFQSREGLEIWYGPRGPDSGAC